MIKELGQMYCKLGIYVSAYELYNEIEMYEDAVVCLCSAGRETQATALCDKILSGKKGSTLKINQANILCCLGDIKRDPELYMRAWEDSEHRCSRAMRTLGSYWFMKEEYQKSVECFNLAFNINKLYPKHWFTCGCAYMRLE
jgi:tetratricopeptide (TPR) repeat protein